MKSNKITTHFFKYPLGHLLPFFTNLVVFPFTHFVEYKDLVFSPRLSVNSPILGISARISVNSLCSLAFRAASDATLTRANSIADNRAASAAASLASNEASVVVAESELDAVESPTLFLAFNVTEYAVLPLTPVIVKGDEVVPAEVYEAPLSEYS